ncbi:MAG: CpXC domain-containing protein [Desulfobacteraceae bacterium]|jgi:hypothetical protein
MAMTKTDEGTLVCSVCGHTQKIAFCGSINGTADPDLRERLLKKELNFAQCEVCGDHGFLTAPLVYYDTEREFCVQFCPLFNEDKLDEEMLGVLIEEGILDDEGVQALEKEGYVFEPHMVLDPEELILYIRFREKLYEVKKPKYGDEGNLWPSSEETVTIN